MGEDCLRALQRTLGLSPRQTELIEAVLSDRTEQAIAGDLGISAHTVHTHFTRLYQRLGVQNRTQLVVLLFRTYHELVRKGECGLDPLCPRRYRGFCRYSPSK